MRPTCRRCGLPRLIGVPTCPACGHNAIDDLGNEKASVGAQPAAPRNAWEANARRGPNRSLIALVLLVPVALVLVTGWAVASNWDELVKGFEAGLAQSMRLPPQPAGPEDVVPIGQIVDLVDDQDADLGSVTVLDTSRPTGVIHAPAPAGFRYVAAKVTYDARADWVYSTFDWWGRDERQNRFDPESWAPAPALIDGRLGPGDAATGWLVFIVPDDATQVWLDFVDYDGSVIFTVQIDGDPALPPPLPTEPPVLPVI